MDELRSIPIIQIRDLKKSYDEKKPILKGIDLDIYPGQVVGYIGPNGAGKTTTVKILTGMLRDFAGEVRVMGYNILKNPQDVKQKIGYIPEHVALYDTLTPVEFLEFIGSVYKINSNTVKKRIKETLKIFSLYEHAQQRISTFSKGMRQKLSIITGLLHNPQIVFLDEPLSGLDANAAVLLKEILIRLAENGRTIFYSSHLMDVVERISDRIIIIHKGKVAADSTFDELQSGHLDQSLEKIFTQLVGELDIDKLADDFIDVLDGE